MTVFIGNWLYCVKFELKRGECQSRCFLILSLEESIDKDSAIKYSRISLRPAVNQFTLFLFDEKFRIDGNSSTRNKKRADEGISNGEIFQILKYVPECFCRRIQGGSEEPTLLNLTLLVNIMFCP